MNVYKNIHYKLISLTYKQYNPYELNSIKNIKKEAQNLLKQMRSHQKKFDQKLESYEIMPYEHLWEEVMNILDEHAKVKV